MIRVRRPVLAPAALRDSGAKATAKLRTRYDAGERKFTFRGDIYGAEEVKLALKDAQFLKCCFCERTVGNDGHVEHFRPKAGTRQDHGAPMTETGYYWLAYEWTNLLLACADCNVRHKGNLFPLESPADRALCHHDSLSAERPLFINPADEDPEDLIEWHDEFPRAIGGNQRGTITLRALRLDSPERDGLVESRRIHLAHLKMIIQGFKILQAKPPDPEINDWTARAQVKLRKAAGPTGTFSAMVRAMLRQEGLGSFL